MKLILILVFLTSLATTEIYSQKGYKYPILKYKVKTKNCGDSIEVKLKMTNYSLYTIYCTHLDLNKIDFLNDTIIAMNVDWEEFSNEYISIPIYKLHAFQSHVFKKKTDKFNLRLVKFSTQLIIPINLEDSKRLDLRRKMNKNKSLKLPQLYHYEFFLEKKNLIIEN